MTLLVAIVGTAGLAAIAMMLVILGRLTQRWELVTRSQSHYYLFYVSAGLVGVASLARLVRAGYLVSGAGQTMLANPTSWFYICLYHIPLTVGMAISLVVTWRNWGWLLREKDG
jgi:hypothetical protein